MRKIFSTLLLLFLLGFPVSSAAGQEGATILGDPDLAGETEDLSYITPNFAGCTKVLVNPVNSAYEQEVVYLTNLERQKVGAAPLKRNTDLDYAARYHAKDLIDDNYFDHATYDGWGDGMDGVTYVCSTGTRINLYYSAYRGENIAGGYGTPASVMDGWMDSDGHRNNLLNTSHREIGVGYYAGGFWRHYWVQDFGSRSDVYPLVINLEAQETSSYQVNLYIYGSGTFTQMRLKNDTDAWSAWLPFSSSPSWSLRPVKGTRTVTVELKKPDGSITTSSDTIYLTNGVQLGGMPSSINFIYDMAVGQFRPSQITLQPQNIGGTYSMSWAASAGAEGWVKLSQTSGTTPSGTAQVSIQGIDTSVPGVYNSTVTITVTNPSGAEGSPQITPVRVAVTRLDNFTFLPLVRR